MVDSTTNLLTHSEPAAGSYSTTAVLVGFWVYGQNIMKLPSVVCCANCNWWVVKGNRTDTTQRYSMLLLLYSRLFRHLQRQS